MSHVFRKFGVALIGASLVALLSLLPAAAWSGYGGSGYGSMGSYGSGSYGSNYGSSSYGSMGGYGSSGSNYGSSYGSMGNYGSYSHVQVVSYWVRFGDTLSGIARRFHTSVGAILRINPRIFDPNLIFAGMKIWVPAGAMPVYGTSYGGSSSYGSSYGNTYGGGSRYGSNSGSSMYGGGY